MTFSRFLSFQKVKNRKMQDMRVNNLPGDGQVNLVDDDLSQILERAIGWLRVSADAAVVVGKL